VPLGAVYSDESRRELYEPLVEGRVGRDVVLLPAPGDARLPGDDTAEDCSAAAELRAWALLARRGPMLVLAMLDVARPRNEPAAGALSESDSLSDDSDSDSDDSELLVDSFESSALGVPARPKKRLWNRGRAVADVSPDEVVAVDGRLAVADAPA